MVKKRKSKKVIKGKYKRITYTSFLSVHPERIESVKEKVAPLDPWKKLPKTPTDLEFTLLYKPSHDSNFLIYGMEHYQYRQEHTLTQQERDRLYKRVTGYIIGIEKYHFKMMYQTDKSIEQDRILAFYEFCRLFWFQTVTYCCFVFKTAFSEIEAVLQCRRFGIGLPHNGCLLNFRTKFIKYFVLYFKVQRSGQDFEDFYFDQNGTYPAHNTIYEFKYFSRQIENVLCRCPSVGIQGFGDKSELQARHELFEALQKGETNSSSCWGYD